jgi:hypothetical protein
MSRGWGSRAVLAAAVIALVLVATASAVPHPPIQISADTYTNATSQHATQPEPDSYAWGNTIVAVSQTGRFFDGGASNVAWSTSTNGGATWTTGNLPGTTIYEGGPWARVSDPSIAYDAMHNVWLAQTLAIDASATGRAVIVNRSTNGGLTWSNPITIAQTATNFFDKNWIACDNHVGSPFYGRCYAEWDDNTLGNRLLMSTSADGGLTWGPAIAPSGQPSGLGGQPVALPNGTLVVPYTANYGSIRAFRSTDGGASWQGAVTVATQSTHSVAGGMRDPPLPSAEVDGTGKIYVAWHDCRFRSGCASNDIVYATSIDGVTWSAVLRVPADPVTSTFDHFIPGFGADPAANSRRVAVTYYYYPETNCTAATCQLNVALMYSWNGGFTWSTPRQLAGPMNVSWIANSSQGRMVGDYVSTSFLNGEAHAVYTAARPPSGSTYDHAMYSAAFAVIGFGTAPTPGTEPMAPAKVKAPRRPPARMLELPTAN